MLGEEADTAGLGFARTTDDVLAVGEGGIAGEGTSDHDARVAVGEGVEGVRREVVAVFPADGDGTAFAGAAAVDAEGPGLQAEGEQQEEESSGEGGNGVHACRGWVLGDGKERSAVDGPCPTTTTGKALEVQ